MLHLTGDPCIEPAVLLAQDCTTWQSVRQPGHTWLSLAPKSDVLQVTRQTHHAQAALRLSHRACWELQITASPRPSRMWLPPTLPAVSPWQLVPHHCSGAWMRQCAETHRESYPLAACMPWPAIAVSSLSLGVLSACLLPRILASLLLVGRLHATRSSGLHTATHGCRHQVHHA